MRNLFVFVGVTGFEPVTLPMQDRDALNQLSYTDISSSIILRLFQFFNCFSRFKASE
jgi:hypothetical protein